MVKERAKGWILLAGAAAMLWIQLRTAAEAAVVWLPAMLAGLAIALYFRKLVQYDWKALRSLRFWEDAFMALSQGLILQAIGILIVVYGLGIAEPNNAVALTPAIMVSAVLFSAILEEVVFRHIVFGSLRPRFGFWPAAVVSSLLFAVVHVDYSAYLGYFLLGLLWCRTYLRSGLAVVVAAHIAFNAVVFVVALLRGV